MLDPRTDVKITDAVTSLGTIGEEAIVALFQALLDDDEEIRTTAEHALEIIPR